MPQTQWTAVDDFINEKLVGQDGALEAALRESAAAGLPPISVSPSQGKLLHLLAKIQGAKNILEIGTLGGYSTIWLARALPAGGRLTTLELDPKNAAVAKANIERAGLAELVEIRTGKALELLPLLASEGRGPFDLIFIDADKQNNPNYFEWALKLSRPGSLIITDNVIRDGAVLDAASLDPNIQGTRRLYDRMAAEKSVQATAIQTVGSKGYDGFALALVGDDLKASS